MRIALIDDGIDYCHCPDLKVVQDLGVSNENVQTREIEDRILTNHGTTCARIINQYTHGAEFISLRLFHDTNLRTSCDHLITALKWCTQECIPIIHLSLGTNLLNDYYKLRPLIAEAISQNQVLIAACSNREEISYPATISGVLSVNADPFLQHDQFRIEFSDKGHFTIYASSSHKLTSERANLYQTQIANSYAAPTITAKVHEFLKQFEELSVPLKKVIQNLAGSDVEPSFYKPDFIWKARVWNPGNLHLLKEHLFFDQVEGTNQATNSDLLLIPEIGGEFSGITDSQTNVLIAGNNSTISKRDHNLIWSEEDLLIVMPDSSRSLGDIDCPFIQVIGSEPEMIQCLCLLKEAFIGDGYQCLSVTDISKAYLYGLEYQPKLSGNLGVMDKLFRLFQADIILFSTKSGITDETSKDFLQIKVGVTRRDTLNSKSNVFTVDMSQKAGLRNLYRTILEYFGC